MPTRRVAWLRTWERWLEQVFERARPMKSATQDLADDLEDGEVGTDARFDHVLRHGMPALAEAIGYSESDRCDAPEGSIDIAREVEPWEPPAWEDPPPPGRFEVALTPELIGALVFFLFVLAVVISLLSR